MIEQWKDIEDYEGKYEVSNLGRVRSLSRMVQYRSKFGKECSRTQKGRLTAINDNGNGYKTVTLWKNNKGTTMYIHRLVANAFIENPDNLDTVNHIDFDKSNNDLINLEWCSLQENIEHSVSNGRYDHRGGVGVRVVYNNGHEEEYDSITSTSKGIGAHRDTIYLYWSKGHSPLIEELGIQHIIREQTNRRG